MLKKLFLGVVLVSVFGMTGCETVDSENQTVGWVEGSGIVRKDVSKAYTLQKGDPIYIRFSGIKDQGDLEVTLDENGKISLLHLEPILAAGLTPSQLEHKIERLYIDNKIYVNVSVHVTMTAMVYYVQGAVNSPGKFQLVSGTTLLQAIADARGPTSFANLKKVTINRNGKMLSFNVKKIEKDPSLDVRIEAGDLIKIWEHWY